MASISISCLFSVLLVEVLSGTAGRHCGCWETMLNQGVMGGPLQLPMVTSTGNMYWFLSSWLERHREEEWDLNKSETIICFQDSKPVEEVQFSSFQLLTRDIAGTQFLAIVNRTFDLWHTLWTQFHDLSFDVGWTIKPREMGNAGGVDWVSAASFTQPGGTRAWW